MTKNIHMLPTDKPSRLYLGDNENLVFRMIKTSIQSKNENFTNQNIYITNDEEIKEGNWVLGDFPDKPIGKVISKYGEEFTAQSLNGDKYGLSQYDSKKIILTTDQNLIKDDVQAIDDEFLKWFVKNSSCKEIEVEIDLVAVNEFGSEITVNSYGFDKFIYKTILPKEESKQETLEEAGKNYIENIMKFSFNSLETKTQANRMLKCVEFGAKWQKKESYSEEDVNKLINIIEWYDNYSTVCPDSETYLWFQQFKKK